MAFGSKKRTSGYGEAELLRGLVNLASEVQSSPELDGIVRAVATTVTRTFGYREAAVYIVEDDGDTFRAQATVGEHPDYDAEIFARPVPRRLWDELFQERYQMGSSFFVDHRLHQWTDEQLHLLPSLPLGKRADGEWDEDDALFVPLYDKRRRLMGVLDLYDPADRSVPTLEQVKALEVFAAHAAVAIENARQYEELESTSTELQRPAAAAPRAAEPEHGAALDARPERRLRADHLDAQADGRLRHHGHPARRRGDERARRHLRARRERGRDARASAARSTRASAAGWCATTRPSS